MQTMIRRTTQQSLRLLSRRVTKSNLKIFSSVAAPLAKAMDAPTVIPLNTVANTMVEHSATSLENYNVDHIHKLMTRRRIITNDTDRPSDILERTIHNLVNIESVTCNASTNDLKSFENELLEAVHSKQIAFGTPLLTNLGQNEKPDLAPMACTVVRLPNSDASSRDKINMNELIDHVSPAAIKGQGVGFDLSKYSDPVSMLYALNDVLLKLDKSCVRTVAGMASLQGKHPKSVDFVKSKRNVDFNFGRFNISVKLEESDLTNEELLDEIADCIHYCGEPGILFNDRLESDNPIPDLPYLSTAPCAELAMSEGDGCHFTYINISQFVHSNIHAKVVNNIIDSSSDGDPKSVLYLLDWSKLQSTVHLIVRLLDNAVSWSDMLGQEAVTMKRRIGIGLCGFADLLVSLGIPYASEQSQVIASEMMAFINYHSKMASCQLAQERGTFDLYNSSRFLNEEWLARHQYHDTFMIDAKDWDSYYAQIRAHGIRNATTSALPPSGNSALIVDASQSIEPYFNLLNLWNPTQMSRFADSFVDSKAQSKSEAQSMKSHIIENKGLMDDRFGDDINTHVRKMKQVLKTATQLSPDDHIRMVSQFQKHIDDSISKTINLPNECSKQEIKEYLYQSHKYGLKGLTFFRDGCLQERT